MYKVYKVKKGDTLESVASYFGITANELANINGISVKSSLNPSTYIVVPLKVSNYITYKIQNGDSLYSIAKNNDIPLNVLLLLNGLDKDDYIYPGDTILIPKQGLSIFVTKEGDTVNDLAQYNIEEILDLNPNLYLLPDQLVLYNKKE